MYTRKDYDCLRGIIYGMTITLSGMFYDFKPTPKSEQLCAMQAAERRENTHIAGLIGLVTMFSIASSTLFKNRESIENR